MTWTPPCFDTREDRRANYTKLVNLPLEDKVLYSTVRIREFYLARKCRVYVSYSGGKDSTVLLHLIRSIYPEVPAVYIDTGLEFPELRDHVRRTENVTVLRPGKSFKHVVLDEGYPVVSKQVAKVIDQARRGQPNGIHRLSMDEGPYGFRKWAYLVDAPFPISGKCCDVLKKRPAREYHRETGRCPYFEMHADESQLRLDLWEKHGENVEGDIPSSSPLSIWTEDDIWQYIRIHSLPYPSVYDMGYRRTGCMFCMFGIASDPNRFLKLKATHPKQWAFCMREVDDGGLGLRRVCEYMGIPTGLDQTSLDDFAEASA